MMRIQEQVTIFIILTMMRQRSKAFAYQLSSTTEGGIISECMEALAVSPDDKNYKAVIASSVKVQQYQYDKDSRTLTLYFSQEYEQLSRTSEMLVRTAIVKTMTQFGGIY